MRYVSLFAACARRSAISGDGPNRYVLRFSAPKQSEGATPGHHVLLTQTNPKMHHQHEENSFEDACHAHRMQGILGCGQCTVSKSDIAALSNGATRAMVQAHMTDCSPQQSAP